MADLYFGGIQRRQGGIKMPVLRCLAPFCYRVGCEISRNSETLIISKTATTFSPSFARRPPASLWPGRPPLSFPRSQDTTSWRNSRPGCRGRLRARGPQPRRVHPGARGLEVLRFAHTSFTYALSSTLTVLPLRNSFLRHVWCRQPISGATNDFPS